MRAAAAKFTDPEGLPRILFFMMSLIASIEQGGFWHAGCRCAAGVEKKTK